MDNEESFIKYVPVASIISSLPGNFLLLKPDTPNFTIIDATDAFCQTTFTFKEKIKGQSLFDVFPIKNSNPNSETDLRVSLMRSISSRKSDQIALHRYDILNPYTKQNEERYWTLLNIPVLNENGDISIIIHSTIDVTTETLLRKSEQESKEYARQKERFYNLLMQAPVAMCLLDGPDLIIRSANKIILKMWDQTEEVLGESIYQIPGFKNENYRNIIKAYRTRKTIYGYKEEVMIKSRAKNKRLFVNYVCQPLFENGKKITGVLIVVYDVTEQVLATQKVEESENKLRSIIEQSTCAISLLRGEDMIIEMANQPAMDSLMAHEEIIGKSLFDVVPQWSRQNLYEIAQAIYKHGQIHRGYEVPFFNNPANRKDVRYYTYTIYPLRENGETITGTIILATDVTEYVRMKNKLKEGEERLYAASEAAELGFWDYNLVTGEMFWDNRCKELYGLPPEAQVNYDVFVSRLHPDEREQVEEKVSAALDPTRDGQYDVEHRTVNGEEKWVRSVGKAFFDDQGKPVRFIGSILDITDKKHEEIRKNDFTAMASHELKTPLTSVKAYIQMLTGAARKGNNDFFSNALVKVDAQLSKMTKMINDFLDLTRMETGRFILNHEYFELNQLILEEIEEIKPLNTLHDIKFERQSDVFVYADRQKIGEVILNFLSNAIKYSQNHRTIIIRLSVEGEQVTVTVIDRGIGIPKEDLSLVFQRFYRSKKASQHGFSGFGIGLYIAAEIIQRHNGTIGVRSEEDKGAEFYFSLPVSNPQ